MNILVPINKVLHDSPNSFFLDFPRQLQKHLPNVTLCPLDTVENHLDYNDIIFCVRASGMEKAHLFKNKKVIVHFDDLQYWNKTMRQTKIDFFDRADVILLPYYKQFIKIKEYEKFHSKAILFPFYVPSILENFLETPWSEKKHKALLTGRATPPYPFRKKIITDNNNLIDKLEHPGYFDNKVHDIIGGKFYQHVSSYKGGIVTSATKKGTFEYIGAGGYDPAYFKEFNLNYTLAKYFEIPACGVVPFIEHTEDLEELGFKDEQNCIIVTPDNYLDKIQSHLENKALAQEAKRFVLEKHTFLNRLDIIKKIL